MGRFFAGMILAALLIGLFVFLPIWFPTVAWGTFLIGMVAGVVILYFGFAFFFGIFGTH